MSKSTITWIASEALREGRRQIPRKKVFVLLGSEYDPGSVDIQWVDSYGMIHGLDTRRWTHFADLPEGPR